LSQKEIDNPPHQNPIKSGFLILSKNGSCEM